MKAIHFLTGGSNHSGYVVWKPVCYVGPQHTLEEDRFVHRYQVKHNVSAIPASSIAYAYFGSSDLEIASLNVSFGMEADGFYRATYYVDW